MTSTKTAGFVILVGAMIAGTGGSLQGNADWKAEYPGLILVDGHSHDLVPREGIAPQQGDLKAAWAADMNGVALSFPLEGKEELTSAQRHTATAAITARCRHTG